MFDRDFYPTPVPVVKKLIDGIKINSNCYILDPQGGKGNILDQLSGWEENDRWDNKNGTPAWKNRYYSPNLYTCEINPDLRMILQGKGYTVMGDDFLKYEGRGILFTHIVMNPPFSEWEKHFLHAWEILREGELRSIIPSRIFDKSQSDMTEYEKVIMTILGDNDAHIEHLNGAFRSAERWTDEEVSLVILKKEGDSKFKIDFEPFNSTDSYIPDFGKMNELSVNGFVPLLIGTYNAAVNSYRTYLKERQKMEHYISAFNQYWNGSDRILILDTVDKMGEESPQARYNKFLTLIWESAWTKLFDHPTLQGILTERAQEMMIKFRQNQKRLDFNVENIMAMIQQIEMMKDELLSAAIEDAFDNMTKYHKENRVHLEGWSTDKAWKVGKKVIFPWGVDVRGLNGNYASVNYNRRVEFDDIDRAMCLLSKLPFNSIKTICAAIEGASFHNQVESEFFYIRCYKKGTVHIVFKDLELLKDFNVAAARAKKWLGNGG